MHNAYESAQLPAIFYYEAQRLTKQGLPSLRGSKEMHNAYESAQLPAIFYYEAKRVTKQGLP